MPSTPSRCGIGNLIERDSLAVSGAGRIVERYWDFWISWIQTKAHRRVRMKLFRGKPVWLVRMVELVPGMENDLSRSLSEKFAMGLAAGWGGGMGLSAKFPESKPGFMD